MKIVLQQNVVKLLLMVKKDQLQNVLIKMKFVKKLFMKNVNWLQKEIVHKIDVVLILKKVLLKNYYLVNMVLYVVLKLLLENV